MVIFYYAVALIVVILDQLAKWLVLKGMALGESIEVIPGFFFLTSTRNTGAAFSILEGQMWLFYLITLVVIAGILYYIQKYAKNRALLGTSLGLILGGQSATLLTACSAAKLLILSICVSAATILPFLTWRTPV